MEMMDGRRGGCLFTYLATSHLLSLSLYSSLWMKHQYLLFYLCICQSFWWHISYLRSVHKIIWFRGVLLNENYAEYVSFFCTLMAWKHYQIISGWVNWNLRWCRFGGRFFRALVYKLQQQPVNQIIINVDHDENDDGGGGCDGEWGEQVMVMV